MTFDHNFCYFILLISSLFREKIVIKSHTFLFHHRKRKKDKKITHDYTYCFLVTFIYLMIHCKNSQHTAVWNKDSFLIYTANLEFLVFKSYLNHLYSARYCNFFRRKKVCFSVCNNTYNFTFKIHQMAKEINYPIHI